MGDLSSTWHNVETVAYFAVHIMHKKTDNKPLCIFGNVEDENFAAYLISSPTSLV